MFVSDSARKCVEIMHMPWCVCLYICVRVRVDEAFVMCICQFLMCICLFECRFYSTICSFSQIHFTFLPLHFFALLWSYFSAYLSFASSSMSVFPVMAKSLYHLELFSPWKTISFWNPIIDYTQILHVMKSYRETSINEGHSNINVIVSVFVLCKFAAYKLLVTMIRQHFYISFISAFLLGNFRNGRLLQQVDLFLLGCSYQTIKFLRWNCINVLFNLKVVSC